MPKKQVAIMGATGAAGLEFIHTLQDHPWFEIVALYASERNRGKTLEEACRLSLEGVHQDIRNLQLRDVNDISASYDLICSALPSEVARDLEERCAVHTPVVSTTSAFRYEEDVPLIIPEINGETIEKVRQQQANRNWKGWVLPGPNCTTVGLVLSLAPLAQLRRIESVIMTSYQAVSGGGAELLDLWRTQGTMPQYRGDQAISPDTHIARGDPFFALNENVIGYISGEEQKVRKETAKILAHLQKGFKIDCSCVRVPVEVGHFETVFAETLEPISPEELVGFYETFNDRSRREFGFLPSSPSSCIHVLQRSPQPRLDAYLDGGMAAIVGRIETSEAYTCGLKWQVLSNNLQRGAAKGVIQVAEYALTRDLL